MMKEKIKIYMHPECQTPTYATEGSSGVDLRSRISGSIPPGGRLLVPTGVSLELSNNLEGQVRPRSGMALKYGVTVLNSPGTIDSDFRGEISVILYNSSNTEYQFLKGDRIAQLVFVEIKKADFIVSDVLESTQRGQGGFGSTGEK